MDPSVGSIRVQPADRSLDPDHSRRLLRDLLGVLRGHLGMEVAFVSRVESGRRTFEHVDADPWFCPITVGQSDAMETTYCARVLDGRIPGLIIDARQEPGVRDLEATWSMPIGSHLSVPVHTSEGGTYGTLCCFSRDVEPDLHERDLNAVRMFAAIVGKHLEPIVAGQQTRRLAQERISELLDEGSLAMALQPIVDLATDEVCGYEALARFPDHVGWTPDRWFDAAGQVGMGTALESAAVHAAMRLLPRIGPAASLAINVSAGALVSSASIPELFTGPESHRLVLELTEHHRIEEPARLTEALRRVRAAGVRVAVDDAGSGYAGLERILSLAPEVLKLDRSLVYGVSKHAGRQAMCEAMVRFTQRTGSRLVAEGVETREDLAVLKSLGVGHAQGYLLGRPTVWA
jgi:EAL domain-containing protein (putative c-di-GMP-specific phosphodiesterase class I)